MRIDCDTNINDITTHNNIQIIDVNSPIISEITTNANTIIYIIQSLINKFFGTLNGSIIAIVPTTTVIINKLAPINSAMARFKEFDPMA